MVNVDRSDRWSLKISIVVASTLDRRTTLEGNKVYSRKYSTRSCYLNVSSWKSVSSFTFVMVLFINWCVLLRVMYVSMGKISICELYMWMNEMASEMDVCEYFIS